MKVVNQESPVQKAGVNPGPSSLAGCSHADHVAILDSLTASLKEELRRGMNLLDSCVSQLAQAKWVILNVDKTIEEFYTDCPACHSNKPIKRSTGDGIQRNKLKAFPISGNPVRQPTIDVTTVTLKLENNSKTKSTVDVGTFGVVDSTPASASGTASHSQGPSQSGTNGSVVVKVKAKSTTGKNKKRSKASKAKKSSTSPTSVQGSGSTAANTSTRSSPAAAAAAAAALNAQTPNRKARWRRWSTSPAEDLGSLKTPKQDQDHKGSKTGKTTIALIASSPSPTPVIEPPSIVTLRSPDKEKLTVSSISLKRRIGSGSGNGNASTNSCVVQMVGPEDGVNTNVAAAAESVPSAVKKLKVTKAEAEASTHSQKQEEEKVDVVVDDKAKLEAQLQLKYQKYRDQQRKRELLMRKSVAVDVAAATDVIKSTTTTTTTMDEEVQKVQIISEPSSMDTTTTASSTATCTSELVHHSFFTFKFSTDKPTDNVESEEELKEREGKIGVRMKEDEEGAADLGGT